MVAHELADPLVVQATDGSGQPVSGQLVNFVVTSGGGRMFAGAAVTDAAGHARDFFTLGFSTAETQTVEVRAVDPTTGEKKTYGTFRATALSDVPVMALPYGVPVSAAGLPVPRRMGIIAYDQYGNPASGANVTFTLLEGTGSSITGPNQVTGTDGIASVDSWTFGLPGPQRLGIATDPTVALTQPDLVGNAYATEGRTLTVFSGDEQTGPAGQVLSAELVAHVEEESPAPQFNNYYFETAVTGGDGNWSSWVGQGQAFTGLVRLGDTPGVNRFTVTVYGIGTVTFTETGE